MELKVDGYETCGKENKITKVNINFFSLLKVHIVMYLAAFFLGFVAFIVIGLLLGMIF